MKYIQIRLLISNINLTDFKACEVSILKNNFTASSILPFIKDD